MSRTRLSVSRTLFGVAGIIFLGETLYGCIAVLGIGFNTMQDSLLDLSLTMAFPIFLVSFRHRNIALLGLWIFFVAQWINLCLVSRPPTLLNPFDGLHGNILFAGIILFTIADILHRRECPPEV